MTEFGAIKFYADRKCNVPLETIEWNDGFKMILVTGEEVILKNTAMVGQVVTATAYIRNEEKYRYAITKLTHPDDRIKIVVDTAWLMPNSAVKLTLSYRVSSSLNLKEVIVKKGKIRIDGYYLIEERD